MLDFRDAIELKRSLLAVEDALEEGSAAAAHLKDHHRLLATLANKYADQFQNAKAGQMQTLSGGTDKDDDDDQVPPPKG